MVARSSSKLEWWSDAGASRAKRRSNRRFMAQPPLYSKAPFDLARSDENFSLVEKAIITGLR
jgi:hypothetical protein